VNLGRTGTWNWNFFEKIFEIVKVFGENEKNFKGLFFHSNLEFQFLKSRNFFK